jgi:hypothetical protein
MRTLSWLCGSMAVAFVVASCLLLLQPNTAQAGLLNDCSNCNCACSINNNNSGGCPGLGCTGTFGPNADCPVAVTCKSTCQCAWGGATKKCYCNSN